MINLKNSIKAGIEYFGIECSFEELDKDKYKNYSFVYSKTNENLGEYYKYFPIQDGVVATVVGSGDQILQAIKDNPKEIHAFDQNPLAIYMAKLKVAACFSLSHYQYEKLFNSFNYNFLNTDYYETIRDYLDNNSKIFWDTIYNIGRKKTNILITNCYTNANTGSNSYEKDNNYYITKDNIKNIPIYYYNKDFFQMFKEIDKEIKFDSVFLSNIYDWLEDNKTKKYFLQYIRKIALNHLTDNGMIAVYTPPHHLNKKITFTDDLNNIEKNKIVVYKK